MEGGTELGQSPGRNEPMIGIATAVGQVCQHADNFFVFVEVEADDRLGGVYAYPRLSLGSSRMVFSA